MDFNLNEIFDFYNLSFSRNWAFLLIPLPLLIFLLSLFFKQFIIKKLPHNQDGLMQAILVPSKNQFGVLANYKSKKSKQKFNFVSWLLAFLIWLTMCVALAEPIKISEPIRVSRQARDLMLAIDLSHSMAGNDFNFQNQTVDRLSATKWVVENFIEQRKGDRMGLIFFADQAFTQSPLTFDLNSIKTYLDESQVGLVGEKTAIGDAIALATRKYSGIDSLNQLNLNLENTENANQKKAEKILILLTDGANNAGQFSPIDAAKMASEVGLKIYPISIGPDYITQGIGFFSNRVPRAQYADEQTLKQIANITGGKHFFAGSSQELAGVYKLINDLEPIEQETQIFRYQQSLFIYPLSLSLLFLILLIFRENQRRN